MNTIDTRDLYKRKCELEDLRDALKSAEEELGEAEQALNDHSGHPPHPDDDSWSHEKEDLEETVSNADDAVASAKDDFGTDEQAELAELEDLESEISDFRHGETLIPESDFEDYARQYAEDIGAIPDNAQWPCTCIDWEQAARELQQDYTTVTYQRDDYLVRA